MNSLTSLCELNTFKPTSILLRQMRFNLGSAQHLHIWRAENPNLIIKLSDTVPDTVSQLISG